jgi:hypothetical protein
MLRDQTNKAGASLDTHANLRSTGRDDFEIRQVHDRTPVSEGEGPARRPSRRRSVRTSLVTLLIVVDGDAPSLPPTFPAFDDSLAELRRPRSPSIRCREPATCQRNCSRMIIAHVTFCTFVPKPAQLGRRTVPSLEPLRKSMQQMAIRGL